MTEEQKKQFKKGKCEEADKEMLQLKTEIDHLTSKLNVLKTQLEELEYEKQLFN